MRTRHRSSIVVASLVTVCLTVLVAPVCSQATLIYYSDRTTFEATFPGLPVEDFEEGNVAAGNLVPLGAPLDSATNNAVFSPGDILPGITFTDIGPNTSFALALGGSGWSSLPSKALFADAFADTLDILFDGLGVSTVGMDVYSENISSNITLSIYGTSGLLDTTSVFGLATGVPTFFGVFSDAALITSINLASSSVAEGIDNVAFGTAAPIPEPATMLLLGSGLIGLAGFRRKFRKQ